ncbi:MAG TPA: Rieske 2Fe-2S domain-containing protein [Candidatus Polarisedimenticolia bacterium]|nr:Rieske 2Fe-2S domain-containing protein [Candidatus Polarisedimenticolia bacterium]
MGEYTKVATLSEVPVGTARTVDLKGTPVALYNHGGTLYATANTCPHRGGPLGEGSLAEGVVTCPWHRFQYEVATGRCLTNPALSLACYKVRVQGQEILVEA